MKKIPPPTPPSPEDATSRTPLTDPGAQEERFFNEINLLRIEGFYFCFDPKKARKIETQQEFLERIKTPDAILERPITIEPHPTFGYPSIVAYKVFQAILKKLSDYGYPTPDSVSFSYRELARLMGLEGFGGRSQKQIYHALKQIQKTEITCTLYNKETDDWTHLSFHMIDSLLLSGKRQEFTRCAVRLHPFITRSLDQRYAFCLNYKRIERLEPISVALYKHIFYHFSNIYSQNPTRSFTFNKSYADICVQWLGGLKVLQYKSKILSEQLGAHLAALKASGLLARFEINKAKEDGFTLVFHPGRGFFEDYHRFYGGQLSLQFDRVEDDNTVRLPMEAVLAFYKKIYPDQEIEEFVFSDKEVDLAATLLQKHPLDDIRRFIDFALAEAEKTGYDVKTFVGLKQYLPAFIQQKKAEDKARVDKRAQARETEQQRIRDRYDAFRKERLAELYAQSSAAELATLQANARTLIDQAPHAPSFSQKITDIMVRNKVLDLLAQAHPLPTFEEWWAQSSDAAPH